MYKDENRVEIMRKILMIRQVNEGYTINLMFHRAQSPHIAKQVFVGNVDIVVIIFVFFHTWIGFFIALLAASLRLTWALDHLQEINAETWAVMLGVVIAWHSGAEFHDVNTAVHPGWRRRRKKNFIHFLKKPGILIALPMTTLDLESPCRSLNLAPQYRSRISPVLSSDWIEPGIHK